MPQVIDNQDGSKTFSVNSNELRDLKDKFAGNVPNFTKMLQFVEAPQVKATLDFVKSVIRGPRTDPS